MNWRKNTTCQRIWRTIWGGAAAGLIFGCWLWCAPTTAAGIDAVGQPTAVAAETTTTYFLRQAKAEEVVQALAAALEAAHVDVKMIPEPKRNAIIIHAPPESQKVVAQMITTFDVAPAGASPNETAAERVGKIVEQMSKKLKEINTGDLEAAEPVTAVYLVANADIRTVSQLLVRVLSTLETTPEFPLKVVPAQEMNAVLITAPGPLQPDMADLIAALDTAPKPAAEPELRVFRLQYANSAEVAQLLSNIFDRANVRISADPRGSLVVQAPPEVFDRINQVVREVDGNRRIVLAAEGDPAIDLPLPTHRVRVIWLANVRSDRPAELPNDLKPVITELASVGVRDLRMVGQAIVNTGADGKFRAICAPMWKGDPATLTIDGRLRIEQGMRSLFVGLSAEQTTVAGTGPAAERRGTMSFSLPLFNLQTTITAPSGHFVVLGVTPTEETTSAFVVQISPVEQP